VVVEAPGKPPAIFLLGPTASGKTDLAAALLDHLPAEIVSVDATLVYRGMDIGSAKPPAPLLARAPHHLLDIRDPAEPYSAAEFAVAARRLMAAIAGRGKIPLLVGGSMLYFRVLLEGLADLPPSDPEVRDQICAQGDALGWPAMHRLLAEVDPETAAALHPNHSRRIQRALEIHRLTGVAPSVLKRRQALAPGAIKPIAPDYSVTQIALVPRNRALLHERIARRFAEMLELGLEDEVRSLRARGDLHRGLPAIRAVGYAQVWDHLDGLSTREDMIARAVAASRQLAKRQLTWLRGWPDLHSLAIDDGGGGAFTTQQMLEKCLKILRNSPIYKTTG